MPPQNSSINSRTVTPAGASFMPGFFTRPDMERIWRLVPRQSALAFDAFQERGLFTADIGAGAAPHVEHRPARWQLGDFALEDVARGRIFVADVDVDVGRLHHVGADQSPLQKAMRIGFEIVAVLEGTGLALIAIDRHQPRTGLP